MTDGGFEIWIRTEPSMFGTGYTVTVEFGEDRAITLAPDGALKYADQVLQAVARAEYDAAVVAQLKTLDLTMDAIGQLVVDLRKDRPPLANNLLGPLELTPGVNQKGKPFLTVNVEGTPTGQWEVAQARRHAFGVVEAVHIADLDAGYVRALVSLVNLDEVTAKNVVMSLGEHRSETPNDEVAR